MSFQYFFSLPPISSSLFSILVSSIGVGAATDIWKNISFHAPFLFIYEEFYHEYIWTPPPPQFYVYYVFFEHFPNYLLSSQGYGNQIYVTIMDSL